MTVTVLDCIERVQPIVQNMLDNRKEITKDLLQYLGERVGELDEITTMTSKCLIVPVTAMRRKMQQHKLKHTAAFARKAMQRAACFPQSKRI